jgi:tetratricopeptide (TPR) repeat protein
MTLAHLFRRKSDKKDEPEKLDPAEMPEPTDLAGYIRRGWAYHSRGMHDEAEADFNQAIKLSPNSIDANYVLGLVYKAQGKKEQAIKSFKTVVKLIEADQLEDKIRAEMLRRLATGHVNELSVGDWNLEKEIWRHED